jgi:DNA-directed RNA polymerase subunit RPC12/RpoP
MPTIKTAYTIHCATCDEQFPIVVHLDPDKKAKEATHTREVQCPFCDTLLTFQLDQPIAEMEFQLRSAKKID